MKRSTKRLISILICLAMAMAILPVAAFAAGTTTVYCQAPDGWAKCNAYWWGSSDQNPGWPGVAMSKDADGIWYFDVPSDATGLIFNNGNGTQTADLTVPTDNKVMYVFANTYWTTYGKVDVVTEYYVAGTASLCGVDWQPGAAQNKMTESDGIYTITFTGVAAGSHKFKVTNGTWDQSWGKDAGNDDYVLELTEATNTVEIRFDPAVPSVDVVVNGAGHEAPPPVDGGVYFVAGSFNFWDAAATGYEMVATGAGVYGYTMTLDAGAYELKVTNGTWDQSWGAATASGNYEFSVAEDGSTVSVSFEFATQQISVDVTAPGSGDDADDEGDVTLIGEGTAEFATAGDAWDSPDSLEFTPAADGIITIEILNCDPGYYVEFFANSEWVEDYLGASANVIQIPVTAGVTYGMDISSGTETAVGPDKVAGSVTYKITANVAAGEPNQGGEGSDDTGSGTELDPMPVPAFGASIAAGQTIWFVYDNYNHMVNDGVYSMMLQISGSVSYAVTYRGEDIPVDAEGFVSYEMNDMQMQGRYVFSVTNNGSVEAFFSIQVMDRPAYTVSDYTLALGDNVVVPDTGFVNTLYEFTPEQTGVYTFSISDGMIGNWGTIFSPQDNTGTKDTFLQWTCTAEGQSVVIGVTQTEEAVLTVTRTGDYVPEEQVDETIYENTYGFDYQLPENPELVAIDVLDDKADVAVLDKNGFYRYGSQYGPLMVADLNEFPINLADAYINGQLRAYVYDADGKLIARYDYNESMNEYLEAGLVPVTAELATMLKQLGNHHGWWRAEGFVFKGAAPADAESAWMVACSYIKGSELDPGDDNTGNQGGNNQGGNSGNSGNTGSNPTTNDISMAWAMISIVLAGTCLLVLKKKENFFAG